MHTVYVLPVMSILAYS